MRRDRQGVRMPVEAFAEADTPVFDLVVLGSGAAGLAAAVTASVCGASVLVIEKTDRLGGTSALSGGEIWIPCSEQARQAGVQDSADEALRYLRSLLGDRLDESRARAFLQAAPRALAQLERESALRYALMPGSADYHSDLPGASAGGRSLAVLPVSGHALGDWFGRLRPPLRNALIYGGISVCTRLDLVHLLAAGRRLSSAVHAADLLVRGWLDRLKGHPRGMRLTNGNALVARLLISLRERQVPVWHSTRVDRLCIEQGRVTGVCVTLPEGRSFKVGARRGVVLASGGFSASPRLRRDHFEHVARGDEHLSLPPEGNEGDALSLAREAGVRLMQPPQRPAAWTPVSQVPAGAGRPPEPFPHFSDKARPGMIAVGPDGQRFVNEADSYHEFVSAMLARGHRWAWIVVDHRSLRRYGLGAVRPFPLPLGAHLRSGYLLSGHSWDALAARMQVPPRALQETVARFNAHAREGVDPEYGRGRTVFNQRGGDPEHRPNPTLGPLVHAPFYALRVKPGDIGTFLGLPTDGQARVLQPDGRPVEGLYATGNAACSLFGGHYPSAGITLGPGITFGWIAARHALGLDT